MCWYNAGVMHPPLTRAAQGFELQFGVNHLAGFALTGLRLPKLAETAGVRVVITSSGRHTAGRLQWDDLNANNSYDHAALPIDQRHRMCRSSRYDRAGRSRGESGTLDLGVYRACDRGQGRWLSLDPMGMVDGPNLYRYVQNNPIALTDPLGLCSSRTRVSPERGSFTPSREGVDHRSWQSRAASGSISARAT